MVTRRAGIDLHTHSSVSDGTDDPSELVRAAADAGLETVAITDHDTTDGWAAAVRAAERLDVRLVRGIEISTKDGGVSVHLLGYLPDPAYPPLAEMLARIREGRDDRVPGMVARLRGLGSAITLDHVRAAAGGSPSPGRPHVADALVALGEVAHRDEAFDRLLHEGGPAYVDRYAPPLAEAIRTVVAAGGAAVVAHPWSRSSRMVLTLDRVRELADIGLAGLEVHHQDHDLSAREALLGIADEAGVLVTGSSDYHGSGKVGHPLGCNSTDPEMFAELIEVAAGNAARSGRTTPSVV